MNFEQELNWNKKSLMLILFYVENLEMCRKIALQKEDRLRMI